MDDRLYLSINRLQARLTWTHTPARLYATDGIALFAVLLLAAWAVGRRRDLEAVAGAVWAGLAAVASWVIAQGIGTAISRGRPYTAHPGAHLLVHRTSDFSFPSDHAIVAGAVAIGVLLVDRRLGIVAVVCAVAMAADRVYAGAHYPSDVLAGLGIGGLVALAGAPIGQRALVPLLAAVDRGPLRRLVRAG